MILTHWPTDVCSAVSFSSSSRTSTNAFTSEVLGNLCCSVNCADMVEYEVTLHNKLAEGSGAHRKVRQPSHCSTCSKAHRQSRNAQGYNV